MENEKKKVYIFYFLVDVTNEKKIMKKIKFWCRIGWATTQLYCEKKKLYCKAEIVLQEIGEQAIEIVL